VHGDPEERTALAGHLKVLGIGGVEQPKFRPDVRARLKPVKKTLTVHPSPFNPGKIAILGSVNEELTKLSISRRQFLASAGAAAATLARSRLERNRVRAEDAHGPAKGKGRRDHRLRAGASAAPSRWPTRGEGADIMGDRYRPISKPLFLNIRRPRRKT